jgi:hypothetical protein
MTEDNACAISELCIHLDGLPLAIELATARIKLFSPQTLLTRFLQDQQILESELRTIPERHRTLCHTIQWSYDLLNKVFKHDGHCFNRWHQHIAKHRYPFDAQTTLIVNGRVGWLFYFLISPAL